MMDRITHPFRIGFTHTHYQLYTPKPLIRIEKPRIAVGYSLHLFAQDTETLLGILDGHSIQENHFGIVLV